MFDLVLPPGPGAAGSGVDQALEAVVELRSAAQQQVDAGAEGGISSQEQRSLPTLHLGAHASQQLQQERRRSLVSLCASAPNQTSWLSFWLFYLTTSE